MMRAVPALVASLLLGGCVLWGGGPRQVPPNPELERSRALIGQAARDPTISSHFKDELERARAALDEAVMIWNDERGKLDEDDEEWHEIRHLNHMARQRTAIVVMKARGLDAQRMLAELKSGHRPVLEPGKQTSAKIRAKTPDAQPDLAHGLPQSLRGMRPRQEPRGLILTLDDRHFGDGQRLVNSDEQIEALLEYLVANPAKIVSCEGHSDARDGAELSQRLSQQRARAVQEALLERGLELSRVTAIGYGNTRPLAEAGGAVSSRRVEIVISEPAPADYSAERP